MLGLLTVNMGTGKGVDVGGTGVDVGIPPCGVEVNVGNGTIVGSIAILLLSPPPLRIVRKPTNPIMTRSPTTITCRVLNAAFLCFNDSRILCRSFCKESNSANLRRAFQTVERPFSWQGRSTVNDFVFRCCSIILPSRVGWFSKCCKPPLRHFFPFLTHSIFQS